MLRIIVCGSRYWTDEPRLAASLRRIIGIAAEPVTIIQGGARGADTIAAQVARRMGVTVEEFPADWKGKGRGAGPIRNREMLDSGADLVVAFKDGFDHTLRRGGTENMIRIAKDAGVATLVIDKVGEDTYCAACGRHMGFCLCDAP